ncbi:conserved Plasmodium protein, unknown function [Plasmodium gallinaceum]|uniref:Uncharacterized protein n=1 Tax=Plasmodium gallinaceum TaxID=5849 RepID=A0A1J1GPJ0_PLAGA|nr:conserved Plasmodium protein, unknown function [Plasmodium gallinaceum]CRG94341.1 conserved Plasmodium protein, unknown function [Plasmodium gallinaceum]
MKNTEFKYVLRNRIKKIFENNSNLKVLDDELIKKNNNEDDDSKKFDNLKYVNSDKIDLCNSNSYSTNYKKIIIDEEDNSFNYNKNSIFFNGKNYLIIENYTSVIYENCEEKVNMVLANKSIPEGRIEIQINGKESYIIPCSIYKNILSCFFPQLEKGIYHLSFFINKEMILIKLLRPGLELTEKLKFLSLHVIEITDFGYYLKNKNRRSKNYNISINNNIYTNKELIKLYNSIYKNYRDIYCENKRNPKIAVGNNYKLQNISELNFYNFLKCYQDEFIDHSFRKNKNKIDVNNLNFVSQLNLEKGIQQSRIPILYKKLLYDNCIYENKMIIMHFHSKFFEYDPFNVISAHIFTKSELKDGYTIFAFNLIPVFYKENKDSFYTQVDEQKDIEKPNLFNLLSNSQKKGENENINYVSTLLMLKSDETNCADVRMWNYIDTIECQKNKISNNFYLNKSSYEDVHCPIPHELINNKNIFKKYSEGLKISEKVSIFFENWNDDILPVQKFVNLFEYNLPYKKIKNLSNFIKNKNDDFLLFNDFYLKNNGNNEKCNSIILEDKNNLSTLKKLTADENKNNNELEKNYSFDYLLNNFVSFVLLIEGKIYHSVIPINKLLLLFIVNYWMHFIGVQKKKCI